MLRGDFVLLETVLVNLLDNAIKHAPGAARIEIAARTAGDAMLVSVTDDGDGIAADDLPRLFDKFFRIRRADRTAAGTGLGLSICKGFVEAMGGSIAVESPLAEGRGARFTLRLPLATQPAGLDAREVAA